MKRDDLVQLIIEFSNSRMTTDYFIEELEKGFQVFECELCHEYNWRFYLRLHPSLRGEPMEVCDECDRKIRWEEEKEGIPF